MKGGWDFRKGNIKVVLLLLFSRSVMSDSATLWIAARQASDSEEFSDTTVQKHQFFSTQSSLRFRVV